MSGMTTIPGIHAVTNRGVRRDIRNSMMGGSPMATVKNSTQTHPGFKAVQDKIAANEGMSGKIAGAILAHASRNAAPAAKQANPNLNRVKG